MTEAQRRERLKYNIGYAIGTTIRALFMPLYWITRAAWFTLRLAYMIVCTVLSNIHLIFAAAAMTMAAFFAILILSLSYM